MKKCVSLLLVFAFLLQLCVNAETTFDKIETLDTIAESEKLLCDATIDDDFEENVILVTFTEDATTINKVYDTKAFSEMFDIDVVSVEDLTRIENTEALKSVDVAKYNQIFKVVIPQSGKQAVLDAVKIIEQHPYVRAAEPNMFITLID